MPGRVTFRPGAKVKRLEKNFDDPKDALKQIGALVVAESQRAFKAQEFNRRAWPERSSVNVFGIIADFHMGRRKPPARRFETRPALRDTGRLASSIAFEVRGKAVEIGTNVEYAAVHQTGGETESKPITAKVQAAIAAWLKSQPESLKDRLGWLTSPEATDQTLTMRVPARPFIGLTANTRKAIRKTLGVKVFEVGR